MSLLDKMFSGKPTQADFAKMVAKAFEQAVMSGLEYIESDFALKVPGRDATIFLHNTYSNYCGAPKKKRQEVIAKLIAGFGTSPEVPADYSAAKPHLMPAVRDAAYSSLASLLGGAMKKSDSGLEWVYKPLAGDLIVGLVFDTEHNIVSVNQKTLEQWGVKLDEALTAAKENLWDRTDPKKLTGQSGIYVGEWGDSYDSSRILLTEFIYRLDLDGDPVACVPNRDALMITGRNNSAGLRIVLKAGTENHFNAGHSVSPDLFVLEDGVWKTFLPEDPSLKEMWRNAKRQRNGMDYHQQKQLLDKLDEDIFVASYMGFKSEDGSEFSVCAWTKGIDSSLPKAEVLGFVVDPVTKDQFMVPWDDAFPIVSGLLEQESGLIPVRYRAREFPDDQQIAQLRKLAK